MTKSNGVIKVISTKTPVVFTKWISLMESDDWKDHFDASQYAISDDPYLPNFLSKNRWLHVSIDGDTIVFSEAGENVLHVEEAPFLSIYKLQAYLDAREHDFYIVNNDYELIIAPTKEKALHVFLEGGSHCYTGGPVKIKYIKPNIRKIRHLEHMTIPSNLCFRIANANRLSLKFRYYVIKDEDGWKIIKTRRNGRGSEVDPYVSFPLETKEHGIAFFRQALTIRNLEQNHLVSIAQWFEKQGYRTWSMHGEILTKVGENRYVITLSYCEITERRFMGMKQESEELPVFYQINEFGYDGTPKIPMRLKNMLRDDIKYQRYAHRLSRS